MSGPDHFDERSGGGLSGHYIRRFIIPFCRVCVLSYSIHDRASFEDDVPKLHARVLEAKEEAHPEYTIPYRLVLVGFKEHARVRTVSEAEGQALAADTLGGCAFCEVSAQDDASYYEFFRLLARLCENCKEAETFGELARKSRKRCTVQ